MISGSCLCGSVAYEVDGEPKPIVHCHCRTCRKAHGAAFSSVMAVPTDRFRWIKGQGLLTRYESSPGKFRSFCSRCGSQMIAERPALGRTILRLGCLDTPISDRPRMHIWRSDGASWYDPKDQVPEWPEEPVKK